MAIIGNPVGIGNPLATQSLFLKKKKCYKFLAYSTLLLENLVLNSTQSRGRTGTGCPTGV